MTTHNAKPEPDANFWRAVCTCGYRSKLCRYKNGAVRASTFHNEHGNVEEGWQPMTTKRSRLPANMKRPVGALAVDRYASSAEAVVDAKNRSTKKR